nr:MAG TPA: hypothetical protein [Caudoviricetes sp.]
MHKIIQKICEVNIKIQKFCIFILTTQQCCTILILHR